MADLPPITRLAALPVTVWQELGARLRTAGFNAEYLEGTWQHGMRSHEASLQFPLIMWHLRSRRDPLAYAYRMFILRDPVTQDEAVEVLGHALLEDLFGAGALTHTERMLVVSVFDLRVFRGLLILCDDLSHRGDAVFGVGPGTAAFYAPATRSGKVMTALDLGCGAGGPALWLARYARRVVATDINPRALAFVEINAALNGIVNVEVRQADLFEGVAGESFDFIISLPPYVPRVPGVPPATYLFGGPKGNELVLRILSELPRHLSRDGRAVLVFDQPLAVGADEAQYDSILPFNKDMRTLLILGASVDADAYSIRHAAPELRRGIHQFDSAATGMREHLKSMGIGSICPAICVVEHASSSGGWGEAVRAGSTLWNEVSARTIDRLLAGRMLLHHPTDGARLPRVRIPEGSLVIRPLKPDGSAADQVYLGLPPGYLFSSLELSQQEWEVLQALHRGEAREAALSVVAKAARAGLVEE